MGFGIGRGTVVEIHKITSENWNNEVIGNNSRMLYNFKQIDILLYLSTKLYYISLLINKLV